MTGTGAGKVERLERTVVVLLRMGVAGSALVMLAGICLGALHHPKLLFSSGELARLVAPGAAFPHAWGDLLRGVLHLQGQAVTTLGLLLMLLLPPLRVVCAGILFVYERDRIFMLVTLGVLSLLLLSLVLGKID